MIVKGRVPLVDGSSSPASCLVAGVVNLLLDDWLMHFAKTPYGKDNALVMGRCFARTKPAMFWPRTSIICGLYTTCGGE